MLSPPRAPHPQPSALLGGHPSALSTPKHAPLSPQQLSALLTHRPHLQCLGASERPINLAPRKPQLTDRACHFLHFQISEQIIGAMYTAEVMS